MKPERSIFAKNLIRFRKRKGFSQGDLAEASGISRRMVGYYEISETLPPLNKISALAEALGIQVYQLFSENKADQTSNEVDLSNIDSRSIKKLQDILSLPPEDRNDLYRMLNKLVRKNQLEQQQKIHQ